jgi:hypothetical protein
VFVQNSGAVSYMVSPQQYHRDLLPIHIFCPPTLNLYKALYSIVGAPDG